MRDASLRDAFFAFCVFCATHFCYGYLRDGSLCLASFVMILARCLYPQRRDAFVRDAFLCDNFLRDASLPDTYLRDASVCDVYLRDMYVRGQYKRDSYLGVFYFSDDFA